jgi:hypothetical protein
MRLLGSVERMTSSLIDEVTEFHHVQSCPSGVVTNSQLCFALHSSLQVLQHLLHDLTAWQHMQTCSLVIGVHSKYLIALFLLAKYYHFHNRSGDPCTYGQY